MGRPVVWRALSTVLTEAVGVFCLRIAQAPATCGVAMEVPLQVANPPPGTADVMDSPGARSERKEAELENQETSSDSVVDPTLTADEIQPGALRALP